MGWMDQGLPGGLCGAGWLVMTQTAWDFSGGWIVDGRRTGRGACRTGVFRAMGRLAWNLLQLPP
ncbi:hypothetical protein B1991_13180 [Rhodanobacter lindaniclasticus]|uniref:Uncharacterized protein n=1 Tax=Rhodanobacter lindaniclasticus TaxID=75310 RepID=A0A4S3KDB9_9GAMM|nr:hypothetical protein B1991_13180 [Rhodanobacter lindaniclasticus]